MVEPTTARTAARTSNWDGGERYGCRSRAQRGFEQESRDDENHQGADDGKSPAQRCDRIGGRSESAHVVHRRTSTTHGASEHDADEKTTSRNEYHGTDFGAVVSSPAPG